MGSETFVNYWIGQEPTGAGQSPTLAEMPAYVNIVPLAFVNIDNNQLNFDFLCMENSASTIQGWIKQVRANGTKVLFSIQAGSIGTMTDPSAFAQNVQQNMEEWGVDGVDIDYEPPNYNYGVNQAEVLNVLKELQAVLGAEALMTAPIWNPWLAYPQFLNEFGAYFQLLTTMDYTPYAGLSETEDLCVQYAQAVGTTEQPAYDKIAVGISCMGPSTDENFTPYDDVISLCQWEPDGGKKGGAMLYTFSYDIKVRIIPGKPTSGTGYPDGTWTETINKYLP